MAGAGGVNDKVKRDRAFDFKMSKKVAELTQVVHMLFTRNHEKEVELDALKEAYELEISEVIADARNRIARLEKRVEELHQQQNGVTNAEMLQKIQEEEFLLKEREWKSKLEENERLLQEERAECQNLRDMLIRAQRDIENLRHGVSQQITSQADELAKRDHEIERLKRHIQQLEQSLKECGKESGELIKELERANDSLEHELRQVHAALEESHRTRDQLIVRNKQLEVDMKVLRRDFNRKVTEVVNGQRLRRNSADFSQDYNEELERLRREVQRYRLELSNRDVTFNRMFTEKQPVHLDRSHSNLNKLHSTQSHNSAHSGFHYVNGLNNMTPLRREKTLTRIPTNPVISFDNVSSHHQHQQQQHHQQQMTHRQRSSSTPSSQQEARSSGDSRLPSIPNTPEPVKPRTTSSRDSRLTKPKPLPKEVLYGK